MSNTDKDITYTLKGERAAMGGYLAQYDTFAIGIYDAMEAGTLEEIRVADMEENVGKLDDVVYATTDKVFAYQIKWSTDDDKTIAYPAFKELIKQAVEGWRKLKQLYPDKTHSFPVSHFPEINCRIKRFFVHIRKHQHFICTVILHNDRNHSVRIQFQILPGQIRCKIIHIDAFLKQRRL